MCLKNILVIAAMALTLLSCKKDYPLPDQGVSLALNDARKASLSDVNYHLHFNIPDKKDKPIVAWEIINFNLKDVSNPLVLDFSVDSTHLISVSVPYTFRNQHIIIDPEDLTKGEMSIKIEFIAGDLSLNRNDEYLYSLFVPDRASTCFPLFDQPNLKATYSLALETPADWTAVSNGPLMSQSIVDGRHFYMFNTSKPISSYIIAFAAGKFKSATQNVNGREMTMYYRETDSVKVKKNLNDIFELHGKALAWLEDYTAIPYPFEKFDFALIPSFQYGGMEHPGSIFYNESSLFLDDNVSVNRKMGRASLIAHETAHMWFGDLVTMNWFNDVWMKEVFANFMAAKIVQPSFPEIDHDLRFLLAHYPSAYAVDRTKGANPIIYPLFNLRNAGTLYGAIIYQKAPIVVRLLEREIGEEAMRESLREYLKTFAFSNAVWDDLANIIDKHSPSNIQKWSAIWIYQAGMSFNEAAEEFPNADGVNYGYYRIPEKSRKKFFTNYASWEKPVFRASMLINIWESMLRNDGPPPEELFTELEQILKIEKNPLLIDFMLGQLETTSWSFLYPKIQATIETTLWRLMSETKDKGMKTSYFRSFRNLALTKEGLTILEKVWEGKLVIADLTLSEDDKITLAYELALKMPEKQQEILDKQLDLTQNPDRKERLKFVTPALSNDQKVRDDFFESLKQEKNREHEAWVLEALSYLHHPLRAESSTRYLLPSLQLLKEIQLTGDIFFPQRWLNTTFEGHTSCEDVAIAEQFLEANPNYPVYLVKKIWQAIDIGERACRFDRLKE